MGPEIAIDYGLFSPRRALASAAAAACSRSLKKGLLLIEGEPAGASVDPTGLALKHAPECLRGKLAGLGG